MIWHAGGAHRSQKDRIMITQAREPVFWHHAPRVFVRFTTPVEEPEIEANLELRANSVKDAPAFRYNFLPDSIARHYGNLVRFQLFNSSTEAEQKRSA
jgi:hypothetical protein